MRAWQKLVLILLFTTAVAALGGAGSLYLGEQQSQSSDIPQVAFQPVKSETVDIPLSENPAPSSTSTDIAPILPTQTPFQPLPITPTPSQTPLPTPTPTQSPSATPEPTNTPTETTEVFINGIWGFQQAFNLSCESRSASDLARYFGVYFTELEFLYALPSSDNPDTGFVGDVHGYLGQLPPYGYGVHAQPVAKLMRTYGLDAKAHKGMTFDEIQSELLAGRPVMVWAISEMATSTPVEYTAPGGDITIVARFEHTFIVIGFGESYVTVLDNERIYSVPTQQFLNSWGVLGNMGITVSTD